MMCEIFKQTELSVRSDQASALMVELLGACAAVDCKVLATRSHQDARGDVIHLLVDQPEAAAALLDERGWRYDSQTVVVVGPVPHAGVAPRILPELGQAGVGILYSYSAWSEAHGGYVVFKATDNDLALRLLEDNAFVQTLPRTRPPESRAA